MDSELNHFVYPKRQGRGIANPQLRVLTCHLYRVGVYRYVIQHLRGEKKIHAKGKAIALAETRSRIKGALQLALYINKEREKKAVAHDCGTEYYGIYIHAHTYVHCRAPSIRYIIYIYVIHRREESETRSHITRGQSLCNFRSLADCISILSLSQDFV